MVSNNEVLRKELNRIAKLLADWPPEEVQGVFDECLRTWRAWNLRRNFKWRWNARLRTTLGRAVFDDWTVELNPILLARHPEQMRGLLVHELAHLVVVWRYGWKESAHGPRWKRLMLQMGESTDATHDLPVEDLRVRPRRRRRMAGRWSRRRR